MDERQFQKVFVKELTKYRWKAPDYLNGNIQKVTVDDLIANWRNELNRINADQLEGVELTDDEFKQVMMKVNGLDNSYEAAKLLSMESSTGKIDGIYRDKNPRATREQVTLTIFKKAEVSGGDSSYKIAREVSTDKGHRFDIILLINGLPLINIEQKRADLSLVEAFNQFKRYYRAGEYVNNFMAFSQMMVITSEIATRYFATPKSLNDFNWAFVFSWADKYNKPINNWKEIVNSLLRIPMAHQLVGDYLVINESENPEDRKHMILRPYQVHAIQAVEKAALGAGTEGGIPHGGYVWHTTGSGKTITSFKTALFLSTRGRFDKVVFLVDRVELDQKTSEHFKAYSIYESVIVDDTAHTYELEKRLLAKEQGIIVTTIFKLNTLVKRYNENNNLKLSDKNFVFIIDEAHRSTMNEMMINIKSYFKKNSLFYGYTGTPLFSESKVTGMINEKSEVIDTTEKVFGPELHTYTIDQAIADRNVLGFHVSYVNTGEFESYESLRKDLINSYLEENPNLSVRRAEEQILGLSELELEKEASKRDILIYQDETHIPRVVTDILDNWVDISQGKFFNAILTVAEKDRVMNYYKEFKKQMEAKDIDLNIAMTFSFGGEDKKDRVPVKTIKMMFREYAEFTGIEFVAGDRNHGEKAYFEDIVDRAARGGSGRNDTNIDLVIVAEQLLTGYDSKFLNTLYVDRDMQKHKLVQAYSRTNRIYGRSKEFGSIINYRYPRITEESVDIALKLYGSGGTSSDVIVDSYDVAIEKLYSLINEMKEVLPDVDKWQDLERDPDKLRKFQKTFREANNQLNRSRQYYEFEWNEDSFGINEEGWSHYEGSYRNLAQDTGNGDEEQIIYPLAGETTLAGFRIINAEYILNLIGEKTKEEKGVRTVDAETLRIIYEDIQYLSRQGKHNQAQLLKEFVDTQLITGKISDKTDIDYAFYKWKESIIKDEMREFAKFWGIDEDILYRSYEIYDLNEKNIVPYMSEIQGSLDYKTALNDETPDQLGHILMMNKAIPEWLSEIKRKYN